MRTECVAFEITETGAERRLDAYETACVLADIRRWDEAPEAAREAPKLRRFSADRRVLGGILVVVLNVGAALCQIAGLM